MYGDLIRFCFLFEIIFLFSGGLFFFKLSDISYKIFAALAVVDSHHVVGAHHVVGIHHMPGCYNYGCPVEVAAQEATLTVVSIMLLLPYLIKRANAISNPCFNCYKNYVYR